MQDDPFFLGDLPGPSQISKTLRSLKTVFAGKINFIDTALTMVSDGTPCKPILKMEGPYFMGRNINFNQKFTEALSTKEDFVFYIIANSFKETFSSHALIGYWNARTEVLTFFDPNGDFYTPEPNSVYNGYGFFHYYPQRAGLKNPLYNTLLGYFNLKKMRVYTGNPIVCSRNAHSCAYRSLMYVLALIKTRDHNKAVRYTSQLAKKHTNDVKGFVRLFDFGIDMNESIKPILNNLYEDMNFGNVSTKNV